MPKDWSFRTRLKVAAVAAVLGLLVWADAHWAGTPDCTSTSTASSTSAAASPCPTR